MGKWRSLETTTQRIHMSLTKTPQRTLHCHSSGNKNIALMKVSRRLMNTKVKELTTDFDSLRREVNCIVIPPGEKSISGDQKTQRNGL